MVLTQYRRTSKNRQRRIEGGGGSEGDLADANFHFVSLSLSFICTAPVAPRKFSPSFHLSIFYLSPPEVKEREKSNKTCSFSPVARTLKRKNCYIFIGDSRTYVGWHVILCQCIVVVITAQRLPLLFVKLPSFESHPYSKHYSLPNIDLFEF